MGNTEYKQLIMLLAIVALFSGGITANVPVYADDDDDKTCKNLEKFIKKVNKLVDKRKLSQENAQPLTDAAQELVANNCGTIKDIDLLIAQVDLLITNGDLSDDDAEDLIKKLEKAKKNTLEGKCAKENGNDLEALMCRAILGLQQAIADLQSQLDNISRGIQVTPTGTVVISSDEGIIFDVGETGILQILGDASIASIFSFGPTTIDSDTGDIDCPGCIQSTDMGDSGCADNEVLKWDDTLGTWICSIAFDSTALEEKTQQNMMDIAEIQNQVCPDGEVVIGIDANGNIICRLFEVGPPPTPECDVFDTRVLTTTFVSADAGTGEVTYTLTNNFDCELTFAQGFKSIITSSGASNSFELVELTLGPLEELEVVSEVPIPSPKRDVRWTIFNQVSLADTTPVGNCGSSTCPISGNFFFR